MVLPMRQIVTKSLNVYGFEVFAPLWWRSCLPKEALAQEFLACSPLRIFSGRGGGSLSSPSYWRVWVSFPRALAKRPFPESMARAPRNTERICVLALETEKGSFRPGSEVQMSVSVTYLVLRVCQALA